MFTRIRWWGITQTSLSLHCFQTDARQIELGCAFHFICIFTQAPPKRPFHDVDHLPQCLALIPLCLPSVHSLYRTTERGRKSRRKQEKGQRESLKQPCWLTPAQGAPLNQLTRIWTQIWSAWTQGSCTQRQVLWPSTGLKGDLKTVESLPCAFSNCINLCGRFTAC